MTLPSLKMPSRKRGVLFAALGYLGLMLLTNNCGRDENFPPPADPVTEVSNAEPVAATPAIETPSAEGVDEITATYIGESSCVECHEQEHADWMISHHYHAMELPTAETMRGDFDGAEFVHFGHVSKFHTRDDGWYIETAGPDGEMAEYKVAYTFGWEPLQQYLVEFPGGRLQAFNVCWDTRPAEEGGQRWYHLYPNEEIPHHDVLHWTGPNFNWNYMCADCHSTELKKRHDAVTDAYQTSWSSMNVSCEACHGPASEHLEWARLPDEAAEREKFGANYGLTVKLKEETEAVWMIDPETKQPKRSAPLASNVQVETCAPCHSHRRILQDGSGLPGQGSLLDTHVPSALSEVLYHADGQIKEEVYVYGSFVQSKMFHEGVRCTDCHHPHTMKTLAPGNALCIRCHDSTVYDVPTHHFHQMGSSGASCVECHMPGKHYMGVDFRRDHSLRIPRPDLSAELGTPNACSSCHDDQTLEWNVAAFEKWYGHKELPVHYGETLKAGRSGTPMGRQGLLDLAIDADKPALVRATALADLGRLPPDQHSLGVVSSLLSDPDPVVRQAALDPIGVLDPAQRAQFLGPLLADPVRAIRIEAVRLLAPSRRYLKGDLGAAYDAARAEFVAAQDSVSDRPGGHMGLAILKSDEGDVEGAVAAYRDAHRIDPNHVPSRINLAELLYQNGRTAEGRPTLEEAVAKEPANGLAWEALARNSVRLGEHERGLKELAEAVRLMPNHASTHFFYGVALNSLGKFGEALPVLQRAQALDPTNPEYLVGLATICRDAKAYPLALVYAQQLVELDPRNPGYQQLLQQMRAAAQ